MSISATFKSYRSLCTLYCSFFFFFWKYRGYKQGLRTRLSPDWPNSVVTDSEWYPPEMDFFFFDDLIWFAAIMIPRLWLDAEMGRFAYLICIVSAVPELLGTCIWLLLVVVSSFWTLNLHLRPEIREYWKWSLDMIFVSSVCLHHPPSLNVRIEFIP